EIGTLRALGFKRANVLAAFLIEAMLLGLVGGLAGLGCAAFMQFASFSTTNFRTFADLSFRFILTPAIVGKTLAFSVTMGLVGGFLP
ncbi:FtsX-like permease family protein, partial [Burkholderia sp. SIMBA_024]|uniref:FtsX-like permease family protein n=1 Tax=Burkholderia sp. SIMBA_024 TaxID=3085768 RepID=UPI003978705B